MKNKSIGKLQNLYINLKDIYQHLMIMSRKYSRHFDKKKIFLLYFQHFR